MASFLSDAVLLGDASQKRRVRRALRAGIRVYAIGGSITASFGGCFGEGCDRRISHQPRKSEPSQLKDSGFLSMFMRELNHSWPNPRHALFNRGIGGSGAGLLLSGCLSAFVPDDADLVLIDYAVNMDAHSAARVHAELLAAFAAYPNPPAVAVLLNFFWCRNADGSDARWRTGDQRASVKETHEACMTGDGPAKLRQAAALHIQHIRAVAQIATHCGAASLSMFDELAPRIAIGELAVASISQDGFHPWRKRRASLEQAVLVRSWAQLLSRWLGRIATPSAYDGAAHTLHTEAAVPFTWRADGTARVGAEDRGRGKCRRSGRNVINHCYGAYDYFPSLSILDLGGWTFEESVPAHLRAKLNATAWSLKPGWVSVEAGQVLKLRVVERGRLTLQMEFLHSYENAGVVSFHCTGGCGCPQQRPHPTRWSKLMSGGGAIRLKVDSSNASECVLHIRHHAEPRVKFTALSVQVE